MNSKPFNRRRLSLALAAALTGGSLFTSCDTRIKEVVAEGTKNFIAQLLDPANFLAMLEDDTTGGN